jgi:hypothetical protein
MVRRRPVFSAVLGTLAGILILASGCADQDPMAARLEPAKALSAAKSYQRGSYALSISPSGGTLSFPIGQIVFPAGAVAEHTIVTATVDGQTLAVDFQPHIVFPVESRPTLTVSFAGLRADPNSLRFIHVVDNGTVAATLRPVIANSLASVIVEGFSRWAIISE